MDPGSVQQSARRGTRWSLLDQVLSRGLQLGRGMVLAWLLLPEDFGEFNLALVTAGFVLAFSNLGIGSALVHYQDHEEEYATAGFWLNLTWTGGQCLLLAAFSPLLASMGREQYHPGLLILVAAAALVQALGSIHAQLSMKHLAFRRIALASVVLNGASLAIGVALALLGFGAWGLALSYLGGNIASTIVLWAGHPFRPRWSLERHRWGDLARYGKHILGATALWFVILNLDRYLVAERLGTHALGLYSFAINWGLVAEGLVVSAVGPVLLPALGRLQGDLPALRSTAIAFTSLVAFCALPLLAFVCAAAPEIVAALFGERWVPAADALRIFALTGALRACLVAQTPLSRALGRPDLELRAGLVTLPCAVGLFLLGLEGGLEGMSFAVLVTYLLAPLIVLYPTLGLAEMRLKELLLPALRPAAASMVAAGATVAGLWLLPAVHPSLRLGAAMLFFAAAYAPLLWLFMREQGRQALSIVRDKAAAPRA